MPDLPLFYFISITRILAHRDIFRQITDPECRDARLLWALISQSLSFVQQIFMSELT